MTSDQWMERDRERRGTVERYHRLKDFEEGFVIAKQAANTREERQRLMNDMAAYRRKHREEDVARGKRVPGFAVQMHQIMWSRWIARALSLVCDRTAARAPGHWPTDAGSDDDTH